MPRPQDKKYLTTEDQERIDNVKLAKQNYRLGRKNTRKVRRRQRHPIMKPQNTKGRFQQKRRAVGAAVDALQTVHAPLDSMPDRMRLPKTLSGLTGGGSRGNRRKSRKVARAEIKDIKWAAKNAGPIVDREVRQPYKSGGTKKKKALKKATAAYKSGGFLEPPIEEI